MACTVGLPFAPAGCLSEKQNMSRRIFLGEHLSLGRFRLLASKRARCLESAPGALVEACSSPLPTPAHYAQALIGSNFGRFTSVRGVTGCEPWKVPSRPLIPDRVWHSSARHVSNSASERITSDAGPSKLRRREALASLADLMVCAAQGQRQGWRGTRVTRLIEQLARLGYPDGAVRAYAAAADLSLADSYCRRTLVTCLAAGGYSRDVIAHAASAPGGSFTNASHDPGTDASITASDVPRNDNSTMPSDSNHRPGMVVGVQSRNNEHAGADASRTSHAGLQYALSACRLVLSPADLAAMSRECARTGDAGGASAILYAAMSMRGPRMNAGTRNKPPMSMPSSVSQGRAAMSGPIDRTGEWFTILAPATPQLTGDGEARRQVPPYHNQGEQGPALPLERRPVASHASSDAAERHNPLTVESGGSESKGSGGSPLGDSISSHGSDSGGKLEKEGSQGSRGTQPTVPSKISPVSAHLLPALIVYMARAYGRAGKVEEMEPAVDEALRQAGQGAAKLVRRNVLFSALLAGYAAVGEVSLATQVVARMRAEGLTMDRVTYNTLLAAHAQQGQVAASLALLATMKADGIAPDRITYNTIISACGRGGDVATATALYQDMRAQGITPDAVTLTSLVAACGAGGQLDRAFALVEEMRGLGVAPTLATCNALISACERARDVERAFWVRQAMMAGGASGGRNRSAPKAPQAVPAGHVRLGGSGPMGRAAESAVRVPESQHDGGQGQADGSRSQAPQPVAHSPTVAREDRDDGRDHRGDRMDGRIRAMASQGNHRGASVRTNRGDAGTRLPWPDAVTYASLIAACATSGQVDRAFTTLAAMRAAGVPRDVVVYGALVDCCRRSCDLPRAMAVLADMRADGVAPNYAVYAMMVDTCCRAGTGQGAEKELLGLLEAMRRDRVPVRAVVHRVVQARYGRADDKGEEGTKGEGGQAEAEDVKCKILDSVRALGCC